MSEFSDYIVYVDESGDHGLSSIDEQYPIFCLTFCVIDKDQYSQSIVPKFQKFKFEYFGHDLVVLHENEIRKEKNEFAFLRKDRALREQFYDDLSNLVADSRFEIIATIIDKNKLKSRYHHPDNPYELSVLFCMERLLVFLLQKNENSKKVHVIFESRGNNEDRDLELAFRRIIANDNSLGRKDFSQISFIPVIQSKGVNSTGLQLADLTARPIGLSYLKPDQPNRAFGIIRNKMIESAKCFP